ncbi:anti-sigma factor [Pseudooceanicola sp. C21-150M6]|uniref:anti-sigma factor n=1 Tax=Pseudooceanicola sp. C21-150M6 TaxID=3434355 RepID=UPI003D7F342C
MSEAQDIPEDDDRILAAEYVLGLLPPDLARGFEARLDGDAILRARVAEWAEDFASLTDPIAEVPPPAGLWPRIEAALAPPKRRRIGGIGFFGYALGGAAAAALAWVVLSSGLLQPAAPEFQARIAALDESYVFSAAYDVDSATLEIQKRSGVAQEGRSLEFWLIVPDQAPVSVLVWPDNATQRETVMLPVDLAARLPGAVLAISDEPAGGSPTGTPTGTVLATGEVSEI